MLKKFLRKKFTIKNFLLELLKDNPDYVWLADAIKGENVDIDYKDTLGNTFLFISLQKNKLKPFLWLLKNGADPTITNKNSKTVLDIALARDKNEFTKALLQHKKIDLNQKDDFGRSLLQNLIVSGNLTIAKTLIENGANLNNIDKRGRHVLYDALSYGDKDFLDYLLSKKGLKLSDIDEDGNTLMQHPQVEQDDRLAKEVLLAGCNPTLLNSKGESFFYKTVLRGEEANFIVNTALECGADVNVKTLSGNSIMMELFLRASELTQEEEQPLRINILQNIDKMIIEYNGDINYLDENGESGLFRAVKIRDLELVKFLLDHGINPNIQNKLGQTVLEMLVYDGMKYAKIIKLLLAFKIDPKLKNKDGICTFEILTNIILHNANNLKINNQSLVKLIDHEGMYLQVVHILLDNEQPKEGSDYILEITDSSGDPLFFKPLENDNFSLFKLYTRYDINLNMLNSKKHNIFFSYVIRTFEKGDGSPAACKIFRDNLSSLISRKVDKDFKDSLGWTVLHKVTSMENNSQLFQTLVNTVRFDYTVTDNLGRSVIHNCVWNNKPEIIKILNKISPEILNNPDIYHIPPVYYAALLGSQSLVAVFFNLNVNIISLSNIDSKAIKKFKPMLKNLEKLTEKIDDATLLNKFQSLIDIVRKKFN